MMTAASKTHLYFSSIKILFGAFLIAAVFSLINPLLAAEIITGRVVSVADGDSFTLLTSKKIQIKIRLHGVDCPESKQDFGTKAKQFTSELCFSKTIKAEVTTTDRYGRKVALVYLPNGKILNKELLIAGLAWHYKHYDKSADFAASEQLARLQKKGLWSMKNPVSPWAFRKEKRESKYNTQSKVSKKKTFCSALTKAGKHCKNTISKGTFCWQHLKS